MKTILIAIFALFLFSGCKTKEIVNINNRDVINDHISTTIIHDTVISYLPQKQEVKTNQKSKLSTDFSFSVAWVDSTGLLNHSIENFKLVPAKVIEKKVYSIKTERLNITKTITITKTVIKEVIVYKHDTVWWIGLIVSILLGLFLLYKANKAFID